jgi:ketosteroid isomerase-like protein
MTAEQVLRELYDAFNARDIERVLGSMTDDVNWPNAWEGGRAIGRPAVRGYWTRQWAAIDPRVEPVSFATLPDEAVEVEVDQVVRDLDGQVVAQATVRHTYRFRDGLVARMDVTEEAPGGAAAGG